MNFFSLSVFLEGKKSSIKTPLLHASPFPPRASRPRCWKWEDVHMHNKEPDEK